VKGGNQLRLAGTVLMWLGSLLIIYVLSFGPVAYVVVKYPSIRQQTALISVIAAVYGPVEEGFGNRQLKRLIEKYVVFWIGKDWDKD
jgi:hypothetical protein